MRIAVCAPQVPFVHGGAEILADTLDVAGTMLTLYRAASHGGNGEAMLDGIGCGIEEGGRRFGDADLHEPSAAERLGAAQVALLREVVTALDGRLGQPHYAHVVKRFFAQTQPSETLEVAR